jgi:hypothetical protein
MGHLADFGEKIKRCRVLCRKPEGKGPLVRPKFIWEDDIKMDLQKLEWEAWTGSNWLSMWTNGGLL